MTDFDPELPHGSDGSDGRSQVIPISREMRQSYLDYAMSVIVSRALPDVRDGLKPVQRRILFSMHESGFVPTRPYRKSARIVGDVIGKYHPHGDRSIYDALVRLAQPFSMRELLVDGQGNFGSMDGDPPAAMRYTEARMSKLSQELLQEITEDTVAFRPNYDGSEHEPVVLPTRFPNLLVNGAAGIAVGVATQIPPHNLGEVITALDLLLDNPEASLEEIMQCIPAPDFPTGGEILGQQGSFDAYSKGKGSIVLRGRTTIETISRRQEAIVITDVPYQVNKAKLVERIAQLANDKVCEGIADIRDESNRQGVRVVVDLKRGTDSGFVLSQLYRLTSLQTTFNANFVALHRDQPQQLNLPELLRAFLEFRETTLINRTQFRYRKATERAHICAGLLVAVSNLDPVIALIRSAESPTQAHLALREQSWNVSDIGAYLQLIESPTEAQEAQKHGYRLSHEQASAILELRLQRLTALEREKIAQEMGTLAKTIDELRQLLSDPKQRNTLMREEFTQIKTKYAQPRQTAVLPDSENLNAMELIVAQDTVITFTHRGYIKRVDTSSYRAQRRGGKGVSGVRMRNEDFAVDILVANTRDSLIVFTSQGMSYRLEVYRIPEDSRQGRGRAIANLLPIPTGVAITAVLVVPFEDSNDDAQDATRETSMVFVTASGYIRRNSRKDFADIRRTGKRAIRVSSGDQLIGVKLVSDQSSILLATRQGKAIRFQADAVRVFKSRDSGGVKGIKLKDADAVVSLEVLNNETLAPEERDQYLRVRRHDRRLDESSDTAQEDSDLFKEQEEIRSRYSGEEELLLTVTSNGYGKLSSAYAYRMTGRGGSGIVNIGDIDRNGSVVATLKLELDDQVMLITDMGRMIRFPVNKIRVSSRSAKGVNLMSLLPNEQVMAVTKIAPDEDDDEDEDKPEGEPDA